MVSAEYESMKVLHKVIPEMVAEPIAWGAYDEPDIYFFVCRFVELSEDIPEVSDFPALLAEMHKRGVSPTGEFGFPITTYSGRNPQYFPPSNTWEECFTKGLTGEFNLEEGTHGPDEEMRRLRQDFMTKVVPRLLRPLETEGRTLVPRLVHGDLWDGNASVDVSNGHPMIFDAVPLYAHNECKFLGSFATDGPSPVDRPRRARTVVGRQTQNDRCIRHRVFQTLSGGRASRRFS